jgi:hypothetical protein
MAPWPEDQIRFLVKLQRLLDEGSFVASYKFALLLSLADLSVEKGEDSGAPLTVDTADIAEKLIQYYWPQAVPYPSPVNAKVLRQNTGKQAAIVNAVEAARATFGGSLPMMMKDRAAWTALVRRVAGLVRVMPLWKLQTIEQEQLDFLYANTGRGHTIELRTGVTYCFRKFHALISDLVHGAWLRYVRQQNLEILGETADLNEFLFGSERTNLVGIRPVMMDIQQGRCFYCRGGLTSATAHVDHFIAWSRYPTDLGHNFVLADSLCNNKKRDRLPACEHLARWTERNAKYGSQIADEMRERGVVAELTASQRVARWAYAQTEAANGLTWIRGDEMVPLAAAWRGLLRDEVEA